MLYNTPTPNTGIGTDEKDRTSIDLRAGCGVDFDYHVGNI
jgi:hypothetical protein